MSKQRSRQNLYHTFPSRLILMAVSLVFVQLTHAVAQQPEDARAIMRRVIQQSSADDEVVDIAMQLIDANAQVRQRTATLYTKKKDGDDRMRLIRFHTPADVAKSGVLSIEHRDPDTDQWLYLPAYHTSRRIASANRSDTYMGTDFTYEDIADPKVEQSQYHILGHERLHDVEASIIEAIPFDPKLKQESGYSKVIYWIDQTKDVLLKAEFYNRAGTLFKRFTNFELERFGRYYRWRRSEMHDLQRNHRTVEEFSNRRIDQGLSDHYFTVRYLERGG